MHTRTGLFVTALAVLMAGAATAAPSDFITDAAKGNLGEVKVGQLAEQKGASEGVKSYGRMLAKDHGDANTKVQALAKAKGVTMPTEPKPEAKATYDKLAKLNGAAFDKEFAKAMVDDHKKDIAEYEKQAGMKDDAQVAKYAADTLPTLKHHLEMAQSLDSK